MIHSDKNINPLVSVIVPVYNAERYVSDTLDSLLASDYDNFEVICVDDGSRDSSAVIIKKYADVDSRIILYYQSNAGACAARNHGISKSRGEYILPFDADDIIDSHYISRAAKILHDDSSVKVVTGRGVYFQEREGEWKVKDFSLPLLARKNMIPVCSMYRREDWSRVGGYCTGIKTREDWDFWISILKDGGRFVKLPYVSFSYRITSTSKRVRNRKFKYEVIDILNSRHPEFFERVLHGPLRHHRSWSSVINLIHRIFNPRRVVINKQYGDLEYFVKSLPVRLGNNEGKIIHNRRNELRVIGYNGGSYVVKSFAKPNFVNKFVYGIFRKSKAQRSYEYAQTLMKEGINTPIPVAYYTERCGFLFDRSYYISEQSCCKYTFYNVINDLNLPNRIEYLHHVGQATAIMHEKGVYPLDYSGGNILLDIVDGKVYSELVDLNRMYFGKIDIDKGCRGFERLNVEPDALEIMARSYAEQRGFDVDTCIYLLKKYRWRKHKK